MPQGFYFEEEIENMPKYFIANESSVGENMPKYFIAKESSVRILDFNYLTFSSLVDSSAVGV